MNLQIINEKLNRYLASDSGNHITSEQALTPEMTGLRIYDEPLVGIASADDPLFSKMKDPEAIGPHFMCPEEWMPEAKSVISVFLPYSGHIKRANAASASDVAVEWLHGRVEGQEVLLKTGEYLKSLLIEAGYNAVIPFLDDNFHHVESHDEGYTSNWSERHVAYICGLGTFGLSKSLITEAGSAGRLVSIVTDHVLPVTPRKYTELYQYCTFCGACIKRCPAQAISMEYGKKHEPCGDFVHHKRTDYPDHYGCGKCQTGVPCESKIPAKKE